jgi:Phospholipase_D-nuclease N-terminal/Short C-terminal domain
MYPFLDVIWTMLVFFGWVIWFWLLIVIFGDLFHRSDTSGWMKALWTVVLILLPFIGVLIYLIADGKQMAARRQAQAQAAQSQFDDYVRSVSKPGGDGSTEQIAKAKELLDNGAINQDEYQRIKQKALAS